MVNSTNQRKLGKCCQSCIYLVEVPSASARCRLSPASPLHHWSERGDLVIMHGPAGFTEVSRVCLCFGPRESYAPRKEHVTETDKNPTQKALVIFGERYCAVF